MPHSVSCAASTGIMDLHTAQWCKTMLDAIDCPNYREMAWRQLPRIIDHFEPIGPLQPSLVMEAGLNPMHVPMIFPTSDDQQAGLIGGGAVAAGDLLLGPAREVLEAQGLGPPRMRVVPARFGDEAGMLGAALIALDGS